MVQVTNIVKLYTLLLLNQRPMHGYELIKELELRLLRDISPSHVYPFLQLLQKNSYIAVKSSGLRDKKQYELTKQGKTFVNDLINKMADVMNLAVTAKIVECAQCGCKIAGNAYTKKIKGVNKAFCCVSCAKNYGV